MDKSDEWECAAGTKHASESPVFTPVNTDLGGVCFLSTNHDTIMMKKAIALACLFAYAVAGDDDAKEDVGTVIGVDLGTT